jgi:uroporphyrin-3 C-methyltransferase
MQGMSETDTPPAIPEPAPAVAPEPAAATPERRLGTLVWLVAAMGLVVIVGLIWQAWSTAEGEQRAAQDDRQQLAGRVEALARTAEQAHRDADGLRARLDDAAKVNQSLREQLLGLGERARLIEDAVANLADKRLSGHDAMMLNEAETLLALGAERYTLFRDAQATIDAYRLADLALASLDDATFSTVRQSISNEVGAFAALRSADVAATLAALAALRAAAVQLPPPAHELGADDPGTSRWARLLGQFIRVRSGDATAAIVQRHDIALARQLYMLDLRDAEAAALARDDVRYHAALADAQTLLKADFDAGAATVAAARGGVETLAQASLAPPPPADLGAALKELRNLRATHALRQPAQSAGAVKSGEDRQ